MIAAGGEVDTIGGVDEEGRGEKIEKRRSPLKMLSTQTSKRRPYCDLSPPLTVFQKERMALTKNSLD